MKRYVLATFWVSSFFISAFAVAQKEPAANAPKFEPALVRKLESVRDAALASDYAYRQVAHLTENIGPRMSGSPQADAASHYVADEMKRLGLDAHMEEVQVPHWVRGAETAELVSWDDQADGVRQKIVVTALGNSSATPPEGIVAEVLPVRDFDELKSLGKEQVSGKIVLFTKRFDKQKATQGRWDDAYGEAVEYRGEGAKAAAALGAAASLICSVGGADYRLPHTGWSNPAGIPAGAITSEDTGLIEHLAAQGPLRMHLTLTPQILPDVSGYNVIADLKGSEHPEQIVIVSGHLDSWDLGTGAIDDAAGVAVAMETVQLLKQLRIHPKRTIRVVAWMNEENGLRGGRGYAIAHESDLATHIAAIESDFGAGHPLGFAAKITAPALARVQPVAAILEPIGANLLLLTAQNVGADVSPMAKSSVPTFGLLQDGRTYFNYHHTAADTLDKVDLHDLQENAAAMAVLALALADMPDPLPR